MNRVPPVLAIIIIFVTAGFPQSRHSEVAHVPHITQPITFDANLAINRTIRMQFARSLQRDLHMAANSACCLVCDDHYMFCMAGCAPTDQGCAINCFIEFLDCLDTVGD